MRQLGVGGNTPCVELRVNGHAMLFDAGTGIIPFGNAFIQEQGERKMTVVLTHYHWDHISGLPFFVPAFLPGWQIDFYGPAENPVELARHVAHQMKAPYFPVETETWLADVHYHTPGLDAYEIGDVSIEPFTVHHPGTTYGYRIVVGDKRLVYCPDNELSFISQSIDERKDEFDEDEQALLEAMREEERWQGIEFMADVDVLIHDAQYTPEDYQRKRGWGHSCYIDTVNSAVDAGVGNLYLFSHDPGYDDTQLEKMHGHALNIIEERQSKMPCHIAREGMVVSAQGIGCRHGTKDSAMVIVTAGVVCVPVERIMGNEPGRDIQLPQAAAERGRDILCGYRQSGNRRHE